MEVINMFMAVAITAIGIGIVVMVGYLVLGQVRGALPTSATSTQFINTCKGTMDNGATLCTPTGCVESFNYTVTPTANTSSLITCTNAAVGTGQTSVMTTAFAGLGLVAVGIIVLAAFGLIQIFQ
jgi:hypothetical protein